MKHDRNLASIANTDINCFPGGSPASVNAALMKQRYNGDLARELDGENTVALVHVRYGTCTVSLGTSRPARTPYQVV